jgi:plasmid stabilization system protein ParE
MRLRYLPRAINDIAAIAAYISDRNPSAADAVEARIQSAIDLLCEFPGTGRRIEQRPDVRVLPLARYPDVIFYSAGDDELLILHVRHTARRPVDPADL